MNLSPTSFFGPIGALLVGSLALGNFQPSQPEGLTTFVPGTPVVASEVNGNFTFLDDRVAALESGQGGESLFQLAIDTSVVGLKVTAFTVPPGKRYRVVGCWHTRGPGSGVWVGSSFSGVVVSALVAGVEYELDPIASLFPEGSGAFMFQEGDSLDLLQKLSGGSPGPATMFFIQVAETDA